MDKMAAIFLAAFVLLLAWVAFCSKDDCSGDRICLLLGVTEKTEAIKLLGLAIAGVVAFWGVVVANRRAKAMADSAKAAADSAKAADDTAKAAEAGNRQRVLKDGVEHLGSGKPSVRQGGAHALFHLALKDEGLRASIAGVLCAHIRETTGDKDYQEKNKEKPSTEMQSLLRLLFTTETVDDRRLGRFWEGITPDLNGGYFRGVELESARFRGAKLSAAQFQGASLVKAQFQRASFGKAQFQGARLEEAQFQGASLEGARFQGAWLQGARFQRASLVLAQFQGASLVGAQFQNALLVLAQFQGALLVGGQFQGAWLGGARFQGAWLCMAGFQQAEFGQRLWHEDIPAQDRATAMPDEPAEQLKASAFHGVSSESLLLMSFEERINDRTGKESDFSEVIFAGWVTEEILAEVKGSHEFLVDRWPQFCYIFDDPDFKESLIRNLESEIGQDESHTPPKEVISGSYGKEDVERWIREFREAMATVPETNQAA